MYGARWCHVLPPVMVYCVVNSVSQIGSDTSPDRNSLLSTGFRRTRRPWRSPYCTAKPKASGPLTVTPNRPP